ncbi:hypothetical protein HOLleu_28298 [Holothuria leucospilota]|uniref:Uncharacterized protein n=1 Tax=Holothuria leucospilota TaxID=206669 RepID=A0A9Q1BM73_HOLLE|nr:hypothetical protein HOLleu_28298 [Holothuria leucospilota]
METQIIILFLLVTCAAAKPLNKREHFRFDIGGFSHDETVDFSGDVVTYTDAGDGFIVTLDYHRDLLIIKNTTSQTCFFSALVESHFPQDDVQPVFVIQTAQNNNEGPSEPDLDVVVLKPKNEVPAHYDTLIRAVIADVKCDNLPIYWMESTENIEQEPQARGWNWLKKIKVKLTKILVPICLGSNNCKSPWE